MKTLKIFFILLFAGLFAQAQQPLSLTDAIAKALENNYDIIISRGNQQIAETRNTWGQAGRYPYINLSVGDNNSYLVSEEDSILTNRLSGSVTMNWTIFDGFSVRISKARLDELEQLSRNNIAIMVESTIQSMILAYYDILLQKEKLATYQEILLLSQDRFERAQQRKDYGSAVTYDVLQAKNAYLADRASYLLQEVAYKNSKRNLSYLMAEKDMIDYELTDSFEALSIDYEIAALEAQMIENNKVLKSQYVNQRLLENALVAAKSSYSPSLNFSGGISGTDSRSQFPQANGFWVKSANVFGNFTLSWNLYGGGNRSRAVQIARIDKGIGKVELDQIHLELNNQLANLFEFYQVRQELLMVARENLDAAELNMQISKEKYESGAINSFNFRDVQNIYLQAALGELQAIYTFIDAHTSLLRITGVIIQEYE